MNKNRQAVLEALRSADGPLSASDIRSLIGEAADTATVYRTLHYLEEKGLAESFALHCDARGTQRYFTPSHDPEGGGPAHRHWFHCERCHRFLDLGGCKVDSLVRGYEREKGISVRTHTLYLTGVCRACERAGGKRTKPEGA